MFDAHFHLRPDGQPDQALERFMHAGGNAINLVCLPDYSIPASHYYENVYERTLKLGTLAMERGIKVMISLGPYPLDYFRWRELGFDPVEKMREGLELSAGMINKGKSTAIGEIGRPHFPVDSTVLEESNSMIELAYDLARDAGCAVVLHTEDLSVESLEWFYSLSRKHGLAPERVVKHHASAEKLLEFPRMSRSVLASRSNVRACLESGVWNYMFESDYVDDPEKKDKVIPPDSVPKRVQMIRETCADSDRIFESAFVKVPEKAFGGFLNESR